VHGLGSSRTPEHSWSGRVDSRPREVPTPSYLTADASKTGGQTPLLLQPRYMSLAASISRWALHHPPPVLAIAAPEQERLENGLRRLHDPQEKRVTTLRPPPGTRRVADVCPAGLASLRGRLRRLATAGRRALAGPGSGKVREQRHDQLRGPKSSATWPTHAGRTSRRSHRATLEPAPLSALDPLGAASGATMEVGTIRGSTGEVTARLRPSGFNRHTFLCGQSGSGKTYLLARRHP
jgi:hypothetical protein